MVYCTYCREYSERVYTCEKCGNNFPDGIQVIFSSSGYPCRLCGMVLPKNGLVWRIYNDYVCLKCYKPKNQSPNSGSIPNLKPKNQSPKSGSIPNLKPKNQSPKSGSIPKSKGNSIFSKAIQSFTSQSKMKNTSPIPSVTQTNKLTSNKPAEDIDKITGVDWPVWNDILKSFSNLAINADHPEIKDCKPEKNKMGDPFYYPGNFAAVFKVKNNDRYHALRFFTKKNDDAINRYKHLHDFFQNIKLPFILHFEYLKDAINVKSGKTNRKFPILKMDWVQGQELEKILKNADKNKMKLIKTNFKEMIDSMEQNHIAHGDLHPKNILLGNDGNLKLVDYDCFYIPDFQGDYMPEIGDKDCQHPNRQNFDYNDKIDRFSALVLYLAISSIEENPKLTHDPNHLEFIFTQRDYEEPDKSAIFNKISTLSLFNQNLLEYVKKYCKEDKPEIESLDAIIKKCLS